jgi:hypothetical protein
MGPMELLILSVLAALVATAIVFALVKRER